MTALELPSMDGADLLALAVETLQAEESSGVRPGAALARAGRILALQERLRTVELAVVADVDARELFALDACASTRGWLRTQICGDRGQLAAARRLRSRLTVHQAAAAGHLGRVGADQVCGALREIEAVATPDPWGSEAPDALNEDQILGLLVHGVPDLLRHWTGAGLDVVDLTEDHLSHREELAQVLTEAANASAVPLAERLEPVLVMVARALSSADLPGALSHLVGALQPAGLDAAADRQHVQTSFSLTRREDGMWVCKGLLDDETGALLKSEIEARTRRAKREAERQAADAAERAARAAADQQADDADEARDTDGPDQGSLPLVDAPTAGDPSAQDRFGAVGSGLPLLPPVPHPTLRHGVPDHPVEGEVIRSYAQQGADALRLLLDDLTGIPPHSGTPAPAQLTVVITDAALTGGDGSLPGALQTSVGPVVVAPAVARRLSCEGSHSTVSLDDSHTPIGASGEHRHATRRERRALHAQWGLTCAVNGCTHPGTIPHHVIPFWLSGITRLRDLVPVCRSHHHDVHEGHRTLRLRNGRLIDGQGWAAASRQAE